MSDQNLSRRGLGLSALGVAAALSAPAAAQSRDTGVAARGDWLAQIDAHHRVLEAAFAASRNARGASARAAAEMHLVRVVAAHAGAEESAIYPTMVMVGMRPDGLEAYNEQVEVKIGFGELGAIPDKTSAAYDAKLEMLRAGVAEHMVSEERQWYPELKRRASAMQNAAMTMHYRADYRRYL